MPSVAAALTLAAVFGCRVEDFFGGAAADGDTETWAWPPTREPCRFWQARVADRVLLFPVEPTVAGVVRHDGIFQNGAAKLSGDVAPENTLVMASCDPAAGLLANELACAASVRLLVLHRSSSQALDLLRQGLVDVAGIHLATATNEKGNAWAAKAILGTGYSLLELACWQEGLALGSGVAAGSVQALVRSRLRWIGREPGSGARQCQDDLLQGRPQPRRLAQDHRGVAEAIRCGWADVGVCVRLVCKEAGLQFVNCGRRPTTFASPAGWNMILVSKPCSRLCLAAISTMAIRTAGIRCPLWGRNRPNRVNMRDMPSPRQYLIRCWRPSAETT